ncbi:MAG: hypothetical protein LBT56_06085 [Prevotellaceae bacterium]|jgi:hypothetical protein|nr:hypothetical protein [Prevotellaceae bacterium]
MKTNILKLTTILLLAGIVSCGKDEIDNFPISDMEYSLIGTSCGWNNLGYDGKMIVINSEEELEKYVTCTEDSFSEIDFSENTLLLVSGKSTNGIGKIESTIFKNTTTDYKLEIIIHMGITDIVEKWTVSILSPKISNESTIELDVQFT